MMQVWEAVTGTDVLVLREVLKLAESDPDVAATVLNALYEHRANANDETLAAILTRAEEAPLDPLFGAVPA